VTWSLLPGIEFDGHAPIVKGATVGKAEADPLAGEASNWNPWPAGALPRAGG
jgi:hypothetical protein